MTVLVDIKYCTLASGQLTRWRVKKTNPFYANFRCPYCGDSKKNEFKARGFFIQKNDYVYFKCQNCGLTRGIGDFLNQHAPGLYKDYLLEKYMGEKIEATPLEKLPSAYPHPEYLKAGSPLLKLKKISQLMPEHPARAYVESRKIPVQFHALLFYCPKFAAWVNSIIPEKLQTKNDTPRLIIPFLDESGKMFGFQGRSFDPNDKLRYITIMLEDKPKIFGLDRIDMTQTNFITEGPIDSMFLPNSLAMAGADLNRDYINENSILVYDNEPRNPEIVARMMKAIKNGYRVCIWPESIKLKDINDMVLSGISRKKLVSIIEDHAYNNIIGLVKLNEWKRT